MKKWGICALALMLCVALCLGLTACGDKTEEKLQNDAGATLEGGAFEKGAVLNLNKMEASSDEVVE